jgi:hypothetical protein
MWQGWETGQLQMVLVGELMEKLHERSERLWEDDINIDFQGVGWRSMVLGRDRWWALVNVVMKLRAA